MPKCNVCGGKIIMKAIWRDNIFLYYARVCKKCGKEAPILPKYEPKEFNCPECGIKLKHHLITYPNRYICEKCGGDYVDRFGEIVPMPPTAFW